MEPHQHIVMTPGTCSGRPRVAGTRIRVENIVLWTEQGRSPEEIVCEYPQLTLADVHAALAFYFDHRAEVDEQLREDEEFVKSFRGKQTASVASLVTDSDDHGSSIPS